MTYNIEKDKDMKTIYHGSAKEIQELISNRPMWFTEVLEDVYKAIEAQEDVKEGFIYQIDIEDFETTDDYFLFHSGEICDTTTNVVKMVSSDIDNNWYVVPDITKFEVKRV